MNSLEEFVSLFAEQFDNTEVSVFKSETRFRDLDEWSSIIGLGIIAMVDEEFDVALKADDMKKATTIEDLYKIVKEKLA